MKNNVHFPLEGFAFSHSQKWWVDRLINKSRMCTTNKTSAF